jgi:hypothetical protein
MYTSEVCDFLNREVHASRKEVAEQEAERAIRAYQYRNNIPPWPVVYQAALQSLPSGRLTQRHATDAYNAACIVCEHA